MTMKLEDLCCPVPIIIYVKRFRERTNELMDILRTNLQMPSAPHGLI